MLYNHFKKEKYFAFIFLILLSIFIFGIDLKQVEEETRKDIEWTLKSMSVYESRFHLDVLFKEQWIDLKKNLNRLRSQIGKEISGDNITTASQQFESLRMEIEKLLKAKDEFLYQAFSGLRLHILSFHCTTVFVNLVVLDIGQSILQFNPPVPKMEEENICLEDKLKYQKAVVSEINAGYYSRGSTQYLDHLTDAIRLFHEVSKSECLPENSSMKTYSRLFIEQKKQSIEEIIEKLKRGNLGSEEKQSLLYSVSKEELSIFQELESQWLAGLNVDVSMFPRSADLNGFNNRPDIKNSKERIPDQPDRIEQKEVEPLKEQQFPEIPPITVQIPKHFYPLSLDVWQSAWGTFDGLDVLLSYLKRNHIKKINLNPGLPVGPKFYQEAYDKLKPLVDQFYASGVENIGFLYAELNYPIEFYAKFLHQHPDLKMNTIVDDSELVDIFSGHFEQNVRNVKKWGIQYSAFVTLESEGNSGVSDTTRYWVLDHVDFPILMSYFGCTLEEQKAKLDKYLDYADRRGIKRQVGIAILLGSKKIGREESCERILNQNQMQIFLQNLHNWAMNSHPSYGGIVLETNLKMPRVNVHWDAGN